MTTIASVPELTNPLTATSEPRPAPAPAFAVELQRTGTDTPTLVTPRRTPLTGSQAAAALDDAWREVVGSAPDRGTVAVLAAHWAHETGRGQAMLNFNFAGIKGAGPGGQSAAYATREGWGASEVHPVDTFRAYRTPEEGAKDYVSLLARRYPQAVEAARAGDADGFVRALKDRGYFTGNEAAYRKSVTSLSSQALALGFDAVSSPGGVAPSGLVEDARPFSTVAFRGPADVPFDRSMDSIALTIDPAAFYDEIARATLHIAGESEESLASKSII